MTKSVILYEKIWYNAAMLNIFQQPWTLLVVAIIGFLAMLIYRKISPQKRQWWQLALPLFLAVAAFGFDYLVKTDTEKITRLLDAGAKAVEQENCPAIEPIISPDYRDSYHSSKAWLMGHCKSRLSRPLFDKIIVRIISIEQSDDTASMIFTARLLFDKQSDVAVYKPLMFVKAMAELRKLPAKNWVISKTEILEIDKQPANWGYVKY